MTNSVNLNLSNTGQHVQIIPAPSTASQEFDIDPLVQDYACIRCSSKFVQVLQHCPLCTATTDSAFYCEKHGKMNAEVLQIKSRNCPLENCKQALRRRCTLCSKVSSASNFSKHNCVPKTSTVLFPLKVEHGILECNKTVQFVKLKNAQDWMCMQPVLALLHVQGKYTICKVGIVESQVVVICEKKITKACAATLCLCDSQMQVCTQTVSLQFVASK